MRVREFLQHNKKLTNKKYIMPVPTGGLIDALKKIKDKNAVYNAPLVPYSMDAPGAVKQGNIDLTKQPSVYNPETKGYSTVWSFSVGIPEGEMLISRVTPDGKILNKKDAIDYSRKTGKHLGIFKTSEDADNYAKKLHLSYERGNLIKTK
jgi:hypothetical protein